MRNFDVVSEYQRRKDDIILKRMEKFPKQEKKLMDLSDRIDKHLLKMRKDNHSIEMRGVR